MRRVLTNILRLAAVPVGVVIGVWTASLSYPLCGLGGRSVHQPSSATVRGISSCPLQAQLPTFAAWECALFGLGVAVLLGVVAEAVHRFARR